MHPSSTMAPPDGSHDQLGGEVPPLPPLERPHRGGYVTTGAFRRGQKPPNAGRRYPIEVLNRVEIDQLLDIYPTHVATGVRDRAYAAFLWRTGVRLGESLAVLPKDFDRGTSSIAILRGKGHKRRVIGVDAETIAVLDEWLAVRASLGIGPRSPIFCQVQRPATGYPWRDTGARAALQFWAGRAGIVKRVHPHGLRHTCAFELGMEGTAIAIIRDHLGHQDFRTTAGYMDHLAPQRSIHAVAARTWAAAGLPATASGTARAAPGRADGLAVQLLEHLLRGQGVDVRLGEPTPGAAQALATPDLLGTLSAALEAAA